MLDTNHKKGLGKEILDTISLSILPTFCQLKPSFNTSLTLI